MNFSILLGIKRWISKIVFGERRSGFYRDLGKAIKAQDKLVVFLQENINHLNNHNQSWQADLYELMLENLLRTGSLAGMLTDIVPTTDLYILEAIDKQPKDMDKYESLLWLSGTVKKMRELLFDVFKSVAILLVIIPLMLGYLVMISIKFVPALDKNYPHQEWGAQGQILYKISYLTTHIEGLFVVAAIFLIAFGYYKTFGYWKGKSRNIFEQKIPVINLTHVLYRDFTCASFLISLASLLKTGTSLKESLLLLRDRGNRFLKWHIDQVLEGLPRVKNVCEAFDTGLVSPAIFLQLSNASRTAGFEDALVELANDGLDVVKGGIDVTSKSLRIFTVIGSVVVIAFMYFTILELVYEAKDRIESRSTSIPR